MGGGGGGGGQFRGIDNSFIFYSLSFEILLGHIPFKEKNEVVFHSKEYLGRLPFEKKLRSSSISQKIEVIFDLKKIKVIFHLKKKM